MSKRKQQQQLESMALYLSDCLDAGQSAPNRVPDDQVVDFERDPEGGPILNYGDGECSLFVHEAEAGIRYRVRVTVEDLL